jgi:hypothetical protein
VVGVLVMDNVEGSVQSIILNEIINMRTLMRVWERRRIP